MVRIYPFTYPFTIRVLLLHKKASLVYLVDAGEHV